MKLYRKSAAFATLVTALLGAGCSDSLDDASQGSGDEISAGTAAKYPIVLVHAFYATTSNNWSMEPVKSIFEKQGYSVYLASVSPFAGSPKRGAELGQEIDRIIQTHCGTKHAKGETAAACIGRMKVHLIGHSQGGLDARYAVGKLGFDQKVVSVTTMGSPHRGTPLGDAALRWLKDPRVRAGQAPNSAFGAEVDAFVTRVGGASLQGLKDAFYWLSETRAANPADAIPNSPRVHYESWAGVASSDGSLPSDLRACEGKVAFTKKRAGEFSGLKDFLRFEVVQGVFDAAHSPNDGHIPVASARSPLGQDGWDFRGCIPADHLDLIGRPEDQQPGNQAKTGLSIKDHYTAMGIRLKSLE
jgi:pimeloyl-ACP methyl ester carboxylesterase